MGIYNRRKAMISGLYCSSLGEQISNEELHNVNKETLEPLMNDRSKILYEKLLLKDPKRRRKFVHPYSSISKGTDPQNRADAFIECSLALLNDATMGVFEQLKISAQDIDLLIVNYMAGKTLPSLGARLHGAQGMRSDCSVVTLGDMGCSAAVAALDVAAKMLNGQSRPMRALILSTEPVSNLFQRDNDPGAIVGNTLFGEGAAAVVMSTHREPALFEIEANQRIMQTDEDSINAIHLSYNQHGPMIQLSKEIPTIAGQAIEKNLRKLVPQFMPASDKLKYAATKKAPRWQRHIDWWAIHPGGTSVLNGVQKALKLSKADLGPSYQVFQERSNMSSPSVLYALDNIEARGCQHRDRVLLMSFGSGFKVNTMILRRGTRRAHKKKQRVAVVIGGTSGIGLAVAKELAREGYQLFIGSRRAAQDFGFERIETATYLPLDVTSAESCKEFSDQVWQETFGVDRLVVSSGIATAGVAVGSLSEEQITTTIDTNLSGAIRVVNEFIPMIRQRGEILFLNSILGQVPLMGSSVYCASKSGLTHFAESLSMEMMRKNRRVTVRNLCPAYVDTPMLEKVKQTGRTFLKPVSSQRVAKKIMTPSSVDYRGQTAEFILTRDRLLARLFKVAPKSFKKLATSM